MFNRYIPIINLGVATTALTFQCTVLYPWHKEISSKIDSLDKRNKK